MREKIPSCGLFCRIRHSENGEQIMKKLSFLLALLFVFLTLTSCVMTPSSTTTGDLATSSQTATTSSSTTQKTDVPAEVPAFAQGASFYAATKGAVVTFDEEWRIISEDNATVKNAAMTLRAAFKTNLSLQPAFSIDKVLQDSPYYYVSEHEVCVGQVQNRPEYDLCHGALAPQLASTSSVGCFFIGAENGKVFIAAPDGAGAVAAVDFFSTHYLAGGADIPADLGSLYLYDKTVYAEMGTFSFLSYFDLLGEGRIDTLSLDGRRMPGFDAAQTAYHFLISASEALPTLSAEPISPYATVEIISPTEENETTGSVTVTSADGNSAVTYTFIWQRGNFENVNATLYNLKNGATGALTIVQDDGYDATTEFMLSVCREHGLKFNVAMIANKVGTLAKDENGNFIIDENGQFVCTVKEDKTTAWWQQLVAENADYIEISSHSYTHGAWGVESNNVAGEILGSQQLLRAVFPGQRVLTFAYPGFSSPIRESQEYPAAKAMMPGYYVGARYLSTGKSASLSDPDYFYLGANSFYNSDPAYWGDTTVKNEMTWYINEINRAVTSGSWIVTMNHQIVESLPNNNREIRITQDYFRYAIETVALPHIQSGKLWNGFFSEVARYVYEYNHADMSCRVYEDGHYEVDITFDADVTSPELYDYPLTVDLPVPQEWQHVTFSYTDRAGALVSETLTVETAEDGSAYVRLQVVPLCTATVSFAD